MKKLIASLTFAATLTAVAATANAQRVRTFTFHRGGAVPHVRYVGGYPVGGYGYHASTAAESFLRGQAAKISALGQYNLDTSQALIHLEQAKSLNYDNHLKKIDTHFSARQKNREYRAAERGPRVTAELAERYSRARAPRRAHSYEVEPVFGSITWPALLQQRRFAEQREQVENLFENRDRVSSGVGSSVQQQVDALVSEMESALKDIVHDVRPTEYVAAKRFLRNLAYEARFAPDTQGVAQR